MRTIQKNAKGQKRAADQPESTSFKKQKSFDGKPRKHEPVKLLSRKEKKEQVRAQKAARNKNFNLIQEAVGLWEELRRQDVTAEKRSQLVTTLLKKVEGRIAELAASHTASRVIQSCVKYGSNADRKLVLKEIEPKMIELSKSPYGRFVVSKLIDMSPKGELSGFFKKFKGRAAELLRHPAGTHVLNDLYLAATPQQRNSIAAEFYGREYSLFEGGTLNNASGPPAKLQDLLKKVEAAKQRAIIQHLASELTPVIEKGLMDCQLAHRLAAEYMTAAPASLVADAVESLTGEPLLHMVHTKEGATAACMVLAYGTAKDRKKALKAMKGHVGAMAKDEWGHLVLLTASSVVDDTAALKKFIASEIQGDIVDCATHKYAHRVLLQLLVPNCPRYLPPTLQTIVTPPEKILTVSSEPRDNGPINEEAYAPTTAESDSDEDDDGGGDNKSSKNQKPQSGPLGVSKKHNDARRKEVLQGAFGTALLNACTSSVDTLLATQHAADVVTEACCCAVLEDATSKDKIDALHAAVVESLAKPKSDDHVAVSFFASRSVRRLVLTASAENTQATRFVESVWDGAFKGRCKEWYGSHADKILAAFVQQQGSSKVSKAASGELKKVVDGGDVAAWVGKFLVKAAKK